jgi:hypothetical protein
MDCDPRNSKFLARFENSKFLHDLHFDFHSGGQSIFTCTSEKKQLGPITYDVHEVTNYFLNI